MTDDIPEFKLTAPEVHSACWQRLKAHFEERLAEHRRKNDGNLSFDDTTKLRGRIAETLYLLNLEIPVEAALVDENH